MNEAWKKNLSKIQKTCKFPLTIFDKPNEDKLLTLKPSISEGLDCQQSHPL